MNKISVYLFLWMLMNRIPAYLFCCHWWTESQPIYFVVTDEQDSSLPILWTEMDRIPTYLFCGQWWTRSHPFYFVDTYGQDPSPSIWWNLMEGIPDKSRITLHEQEFLSQGILIHVPSLFSVIWLTVCFQFSDCPAFQTSLEFLQDTVFEVCQKVNAFQKSLCLNTSDNVQLLWTIFFYLSSIT